MRVLYLFVALLSVVISGCATDQTPPPRIVYQEVKIPVAVGCVRSRPETVQPLRKQIADAAWIAMPTGAKAEAVKAQAGRHQNYEDSLSASVAGCSDAPATPALAATH